MTARRGIGVWGIVNYEVSVPVGHFPLDYQASRPVRNQLSACVAGAAYNVAKALTTLGHDVHFTCMVANDITGLAVRAALLAESFADVTIIDTPATPQSVVLYDSLGRHQILNDLKFAIEADIPVSTLDNERCQTAVLTNVEANRKLLGVAKSKGMRVVTDVHALTDVHDSYNADFCRVADVLFMSDAALDVDRGDWLQTVARTYSTPIAILGMGGNGALLATGGGSRITHFPAKTPRRLASAVGAGDSLLAAFVDGLERGHSPEEALERATVYAGYKVGEAGGSRGFLSARALDGLVRESALS